MTTKKKSAGSIYATGAAARALFDAMTVPRTAAKKREPTAAYIEEIDTDPGDSDSLRRLRNLIDDKLGWRDFEQQERGNHEARLIEIATALAVLRRMWVGDDVDMGEATNAHDTLKTAVFP